MRLHRAALVAALPLALLATACSSSSKGSSGATTTAAAGGATTTVGGPATTTAGGTTTAAPAGKAISFKALDAAGPITIAALDNGDIQLAAFFTSDGTIAAKGWVVLEDDKRLQPAQNLIPVVRKTKVDDATDQIMGELMADISLPELQALNKKITVDKADPADVAKQFVTDKGLLKAEPKITSKLTIGSANFYEQELVANMASLVLKAHGADVTLKTKLGARPVVDAAMQRGDIDLYIEYVGSYLAFVRGDDKSPNATDTNKAVAELNTLLAPKGLIMLDPSPAEDKDGLVVTKATADIYQQR